MSRPSFAIEIGSSFAADLRRAQKSVYKKDSRGREEFAALVENALISIRLDPYSNAYPNQVKGTTERYPAGHAREKCLLRKLRFTLPRSAGATSFGRILFDVHTEDYVIRVLAFYTHQDYPGNYSNEELIKRL